MDKQSINEQHLYEEANKWLTENGDFKNTFIEDRSVFKIEFTTKEEVTVLEGQDLKKLTIQLHFEINN